MMNRLLWSMMLVILLSGCEPSPTPPNQSVKVAFDHTNLSIPRKYLLPPLPSSFISSKGMDKDSGALLAIPLQDLGYNVGIGINFHYNLQFLITPLSIHHSPNLPPSGLHAWNGSGNYKNRIIEFDKTTQLYRVYGTEYRRSWEFFKSFPSHAKSPVEEWIADCDIKFSETNLSNFSNIICTTVFIHKDIHIQMTFSGEYIPLIEEFKQKIKELFHSWEIEK